MRGRIGSVVVLQNRRTGNTCRAIIRQGSLEVPSELEAATDGRQNRDLAALRQFRFEQLFATDVLVFEKNIDVTADLAALSQHAIAHARIRLPELRQRIA